MTTTSNVSTAKQTGGVGGIAGALIAVLVGFEVVHWSAGQVVLVGAATAAGLAVIGSVYAHFRPGTTEEPIAIGASVTAFLPSLIAVLVGFQVLSWSDEQIGLAMSLVTLVVAAVSAKLARGVVWTKRSVQESPNVEPQDAFH